MKHPSTLIITFLIAARYVAAHGYVKTVTIAGKSYEANYPFGDGGPSGIRKVDDVTPIKGAKNPDVECGIKAQPASQVLSANPGDALTFDWRGADDSFVSCFRPYSMNVQLKQSQWPHDMGPLLTLSLLGLF